MQAEKMLDLRGINAMIFDFDGVLGDTSEDNYRGWCHALARYDSELGREEYFVLEGRTVTETARVLLERRGLAPELAEATGKAKDQHCIQSGSPKLFPQALEVLRFVKALGLKRALVSGGSALRLRQPQYAAALEFMDVLVSGDDVQSGKPAPDPYLLSADKLGVQPAQCLVIENAPLGIESALSAGMRCVALCTTLSAKHLARAELILPDLGNLLSLLKQATQKDYK